MSGILDFFENMFAPKVQSPIPQNQVLNTPDKMAGAQLKQSGDAFNQDIDNFNAQKNQPTPTQPQITPFANNTPAWSQPSTSPTPTPFGKNPLDGYVMDTPHEYTPIINDASKQYGVPSSLLSSLLSHESMHWNPDVISGKLNSPVGAQGIAQFMPDTAKGMGINPLDVKQAIHGAAKLLRSHYDQFNQRPDFALAAYNSGASNVEKYGGIPPFPETINYVKNIMHDANSTYGGQ